MIMPQSIYTCFSSYRGNNGNGNNFCNFWRKQLTLSLTSVISLRCLWVKWLYQNSGLCHLHKINSNCRLGHGAVRSNNVKNLSKKACPLFPFHTPLIEFISWSTQQRETTCVCLVHYFSLSGHLIVHYHTYLRTFQNMGTWSFVLLSVRYTSLANLGYYFLQNMQPFRCSQCSLDEPGCFWLKK